MVKELHELLEASALDAPAEPHPVSEIVTRARRQQRRRTAAAVAAASVAVIVASGVGYAGLRALPGSEPVPVAVAIGVADAEPAVPGQDYTVVRSRPAEQGGDFTSFGPPSADGSVLVASGGNHPSFGVMSLGSEDVVPLEAPPGGVGTWVPSVVDSGVVVWRQDPVMSGELEIQDRETGDWTDVTLDLEDLGPASEGHFGPRLGGLWVVGDRLWFTVQSAEDETDVRAGVYSTALDGSGEPTREVDDWVAGASVDGEQLALLPYPADDATSVQVRDLGTGDERRVSVDPGTGCVLVGSGFQISGDRVGVYRLCGKPGTSGALVVTTDGDPVVRLDGAALVGNGLGTNAMVVRDQDENELLYRFDAARLVRLEGASAGQIEGTYLSWLGSDSGQFTNFLARVD